MLENNAKMIELQFVHSLVLIWNVRERVHFPRSFRRNVKLTQSFFKCLVMLVLACVGVDVYRDVVKVSFEK